MRTILVLLSLAAAVALVPAELRAQEFTVTIKNHPVYAERTQGAGQQANSTDRGQ